MTFLSESACFMNVLLRRIIVSMRRGVEKEEGWGGRGGGDAESPTGVGLIS